MGNTISSLTTLCASDQPFSSAHPLYPKFYWYSAATGVTTVNKPLRVKHQPPNWGPGGPILIMDMPADLDETELRARVRIIGCQGREGRAVACSLSILGGLHGHRELCAGPRAHVDIQAWEDVRGRKGAERRIKGAAGEGGDTLENTSENTSHNTSEHALKNTLENTSYEGKAKKPRRYGRVRLDDIVFSRPGIFFMGVNIETTYGTVVASTGWDERFRVTVEEEKEVMVGKRDRKQMLMVRTTSMAESS